MTHFMFLDTVFYHFSFIAPILFIQVTYIKNKTNLFNNRKRSSSNYHNKSTPSFPNYK
jgi:hypothetical protein